MIAIHPAPPTRARTPRNSRPRAFSDPYSSRFGEENATKQRPRAAFRFPRFGMCSRPITSWPDPRRARTTASLIRLLPAKKSTLIRLSYLPRSSIAVQHAANRSTQAVTPAGQSGSLIWKFRSSFVQSNSEFAGLWAPVAFPSVPMAVSRASAGRRSSEDSST